jgi:hypothetical protein
MAKASRPLRGGAALRADIRTSRSTSASRANASRPSRLLRPERTYCAASVSVDLLSV